MLSGQAEGAESEDSSAPKHVLSKIEGSAKGKEEI
jgi:hypothetical protein